jgi:pimeloyl-ACP methyl ester carboxylesterase
MKLVFHFFYQFMLITLSLFLVFLLLISGIFWVYSPWKAKPFLDESGNILAGSISEKIRVSINGVEQGMFIKGKDKTKPVLLFLHGGLPAYFLTDRYPTRLEELFVVCWWDQRGSGLSYSPKIARETVTLEQLLADTKEVTNYLRQRFGQQKIFLMGHSGGTFIGIQAAARFPELYHAYIAVSQMTKQFLSEKLAQEYMIGEYQKIGDLGMLGKLEGAPIGPGIPNDYLAIRDKAMHGLGIGTTRDMKSVITGVFLESLKNQEYTLGEKIKLWRGKASSGVHPLWKTMIANDLAKEVTSLKIPIYFIHGKYDYTTNYDLAKNYFEKLQAPLKRFYTFEQSAHSPMFEEAEKMRQIMELIIL